MLVIVRIIIIEDDVVELGNALHVETCRVRKRYVRTNAVRQNILKINHVRRLTFADTHIPVVINRHRRIIRILRVSRNSLTGI